jgi:hypothetical protein
MEFYAQVEAAIDRRQVPDARQERIHWREGGPLSPKREYLRVRRREHVFDICAAPFGNGFFVSWWLGEFRGCLAALAEIPWLGLFLQRLRPVTYYRVDTALMFQESVHHAVLEVVDQLTEAKGLRALTEAERKPILREIFRR